MSLSDAIVSGLKALGVFDFIIPFMLIWAIVYGVLIRSKLFGDAFDTENKERARMVRSLSSLIATAVALLVVGTAYIVGLIQAVVPWVAFTMLALLSGIMIVAVLSLTGTQVGDVFPDWFKKLVAVVAFLVVISVILWYAFFRNVPVSSTDFESLAEEYKELIAAIIIFMILLGFVYFLVREPSQSSGRAGGDGYNQRY